MKCLKIELHQTSVCYRKPETVENAMTYPLPPVHTVIGAIHAACGWNKYHDMRVAIQGEYTSMGRRMYKRKVYYNNVQKDRGYFCKMLFPGGLSNAHTIIAEPLNGWEQGKRNFLTGAGYKVIRPDLVQEYEELAEKQKEIAGEIKELNARKAGISLGSKQELKEIRACIKELRAQEAEIKQKRKLFFSYENVPSWAEILYDVDLTLHIFCDDLQEILDNVYNIKCLGRSEDAVSIKSASIVDCDRAQAGAVLHNHVYLNTGATACIKNSSSGTVYYLNNHYDIVEGKRIFDKIRCLYTSISAVIRDSDDILIDSNGVVFAPI